MGSNGFITALISVIIAGSLVTGSVVLILNNQDDDNTDDNNEFVLDDGILDYVSLGASNTNGYGMSGYISAQDVADIISGKVSKDDVNVYGYQKIPEGSYPDLIRDHYVGVYGENNVKIDQLAISSMRVEELRILLDDTYMGDGYSTWRFIGEDGWFIAAEEGGLDALRATYKEKVSNADLITVDIGWNNFGVYICNQLVDYMKKGSYKWTVNLAEIYDTDAEVAAATQAKEIIRGYVETNVGSGDIADAITDIFAYALFGYMHNFDIVMDKIHTMNPDAKVVVIGIQNLLHGVVVEINDREIPLGDIFGNFVDMGNYYASSCSPHKGDYRFVKAGVDGHVSVFLDIMKGYDGDTEKLNHNVVDCFNYYDNNINVQPMLDYFTAEMINTEYGSMLSTLGFGSAEEAVAAGKNGTLDDNNPFIAIISLQKTFDEMYWPALNAAYNTVAQLVKAIANTPTFDASGLLAGTLDVAAEEDALKDKLMNEIIQNVTQAMNGEDYVVDVETIIDNANTEIVAGMYIRFYMGNSFYAHPDEIGHKQIESAVINVLDNPDSAGFAIDKDLADDVKEIVGLLDGAT